MKRVILLILAGIFIFAKGKSEILDLKTRVLNGDPEGSAPPRRSPILVPIVDQEGTCFYFEQCNYQNAILQIIEDGVAVYTVTVPTDTNQVQLPESLQGDYEFDLICGNHCFYSDITL